MGNRIGEACWYKHEGKWKGGKLRAWSVDYNDGCNVQFAAAVVEDDETLRCFVVYAERVSFAQEPPRD